MKADERPTFFRDGDFSAACLAGVQPVAAGAAQRERRRLVAGHAGLAAVGAAGHEQVAAAVLLVGEAGQRLVDSLVGQRGIEHLRESGVPAAVGGHHRPQELRERRLHPVLGDRRVAIGGAEQVGVVRQLLQALDGGVDAAVRASKPISTGFCTGSVDCASRFAARLSQNMEPAWKKRRLARRMAWAVPLLPSKPVEKRAASAKSACWLWQDAQDSVPLTLNCLSWNSTRPSVATTRFSTVPAGVLSWAAVPA
jgi:hypothetical protein